MVRQQNGRVPTHVSRGRKILRSYIVLIYSVYGWLFVVVVEFDEGGLTF